MKSIFYNPVCDFIMPDYGILIPIAPDRAKKIFEALKNKHPNLTFTDMSGVEIFSREDLERVHDKEYISKLLDDDKSLEQEMLKCFELVNELGEYHRYDPTIAKKSLISGFAIILKRVSMTYASSLKALETGFSYHFGAGMHHAMSFGGRGFGMLNDIVLTIRKLQAHQKIKTAWVIDVDAHKGDGTSELTKNDPTIITLSIHMKNGWPLDSGDPLKDPWFIPSNIDIEVDEHSNREYLSLLQKGLEKLKTNYPLPDLAIVVNGSDPYELDELPSTSLLKLTKEEMLQRDLMVFHFLEELKIPQSYVMAGGYGKHSHEIYQQFLEKIL
ncbi:MAG: hypothetical protein L6Q33_02480 [Bacteriovoracaceae bacterium]|nr:hypothetical protein [Bacteriovoracaceae bacterium]